MPELRGLVCSGFLGVQDVGGRLGVMYMESAGVWHRFFLDAGLLFWAEGPGPDAEEDLLAGDEYVDLGAQLGVIGEAIGEIVMANCVLTLEFANGARLVLEQGVLDVYAQLRSHETQARRPPRCACAR
ncbi:hypothetical protein [Enhygromyxa salina]|uniref:hypothetical protein n=1 Tax=Enhygromyxa salina TaxID=215803 RepID=UPI0011BAA3FF|nr:hypothetical protein [Enhygromyxa salina]